ncbi:MAG: aldehyde dehydrogenase family protein [Cyanobacteria bacterium QH_2_48_84]|nr:MAG: aldehyde dehydrogenase family protein [Cyanobacteria bacterium QH_2_48_84]
MLTQIATSKIVKQQRRFFESGKTNDVAFRIETLKRLKQAITDHETAIAEALQADLNKPKFEAIASEIAFCREEIDYALKHIKSWTNPKKVSTPVNLFPAKSQVIAEPLGVVLIVAPWNFPFQLAMVPLIGAIAAGNCAIIKLSEVASHTSNLIADLISKTFNPGIVKVVEGGKETTQQLLAEKFDHIFFTGGTQVGKIIMKAAAENLTPVTLELGGKSPCIVDSNIHIEHAARRITWGKFINAGQTCVAPDYLLVHRSIKEQLLAAMKQCLQEFYGENPANSPDYARIINDNHYNRLSQLLEAGEIVVGGETDAAQRYIAPTIIDQVDWDDAVMQEEIFGPILPVLEYEELEEAIASVNACPKPLALYFFSKDRATQKQVLQETSSGGTGINDTIMQLMSPELPFGGVGNSGIGAYHGKASFDTFSHQRSILTQSFLLDIKLRYPPYEGKLKFLNWLFK